MGGPSLVSPRWFRARDNPMTRPWREVEYVVVDLETTGLDLRHDTIASYGAVMIRGGRMIVGENTYGLVCTTCDMDPASVAVHTLRPADVADAPPLADAVAIIQSLLDARVLVAHAAWIERAFLTRAFAEHDTTLRSPIIDTAALARAADRARRTRGGSPTWRRWPTISDCRSSAHITHWAMPSRQPRFSSPSRPSSAGAAT
jgi:DNA polymerase III subunit epsilon